jgi:hypothetical protein
MRGSLAATVAALLFLAAGAIPAVAQLPRCKMRLSVQLTPDVPNARDPGFLSSLAGDPRYQLIWVRSTDTRVILELIGPGPRYRCSNEVSRIRRDGRVLKLQAIGAGGQPAG